jgi:hypothetical protein
MALSDAIYQVSRKAIGGRIEECHALAGRHPAVAVSRLDLPGVPDVYLLSRLGERT